LITKAQKLMVRFGLDLLLFAALFFTGLSTAVLAAGPYTYSSSSSDVYEAAPDHTRGWPYRASATVKYYTYSSYERITSRPTKWNILSQGIDSNCQIDWVETSEGAQHVDMYTNWYDYNNTPVTLYGWDYFVAPKSGSAPYLTEMYYGWTDYGSDCGMMTFVWGPETGGWIMQTYYKNSAWKWNACHHNAGDPDCPVS